MRSSGSDLQVGSRRYVVRKVPLAEKQKKVLNDKIVSLQKQLKGKSEELVRAKAQLTSAAKARNVEGYFGECVLKVTLGKLLSQLSLVIDE